MHKLNERAAANLAVPELIYRVGVNIKQRTVLSRKIDGDIRQNITMLLAQLTNSLKQNIVIRIVMTHALRTASEPIGMLDHAR